MAIATIHLTRSETLPAMREFFVVQGYDERNQQVLVGSVGLNGVPLVLIAVGIIVLVSSLRSRRVIVS